jgi:hypothetical protein
MGLKKKLLKSSGLEGKDFLTLSIFFAPISLPNLHHWPKQTQTTAELLTEFLL